AAKAEGAAAEEEEDEDNEIPGTIKSYDSSRRLLVVSLLNSQSPSFLLSRNVRVQVRGRTSSQGLDDAPLKAGNSRNVGWEPARRRVRELQLHPAAAAAAKIKKAS